MTDHDVQHQHGDPYGDAGGGTGSVAALKGHLLAPMLVPLVIGTYVAATEADICFAISGDLFWARSASWLLLASLGADAVAVYRGSSTFARSAGLSHFLWPARML